MLADDVRLDVVERLQATGRGAVGPYFRTYQRFVGWRVVQAWLDGREVLAVFLGTGDALRISSSWRTISCSGSS
jgi:RNA polymerase sigma-70 factor (ECF subfamily)